MTPQPQPPAGSANAQSVDPSLPNYNPVPRPNIAMTAPSDLPQTNQGAPPVANPFVGDFNMPPMPARLYITPLQRDIIVMLLKAQGLWPDGTVIKNDADQLGLEPSIGDAQFYSMYWREGNVWRCDNLGETYWLFQDQLWAAKRAHNPPPKMRRDPDGSIAFGILSQ